MRTIFTAVAAVFICAAMACAQQSPPADGVGIGNDHLSPNGTTSDVPSMSPDQNGVMTDSNGSTTGDKGIPAFAGSSEDVTATRMNSQGTMGARGSTEATAARRRANRTNQPATQTQPPMKPGQRAKNKKPNRTAKNANASAGKRTYQDKLLGANMGPSTTEAPGPSTGVQPRKPPK